MTDRTAKALLVAIAVALWGILLRPLFTPAPVQAQRNGPAGGAGAPAIHQAQNGVLYVAADGYLSMYQPAVQGNAGERRRLDSKELPARR
jgi:hypothetical protein